MFKRMAEEQKLAEEKLITRESQFGCEIIEEKYDMEDSDEDGAGTGKLRTTRGAKSKN